MLSLLLFQTFFYYANCPLPLHPFLALGFSLLYRSSFSTYVCLQNYCSLDVKNIYKVFQLEIPVSAVIVAISKTLPFFKSQALVSVSDGRFSCWKSLAIQEWGRGTITAPRLEILSTVFGPVLWCTHKAHCPYKQTDGAMIFLTLWDTNMQTIFLVS